MVANDTLDLANLSLLYRASSLARALKLTIDEYQKIQKVAGIDPVAPVAATATEPRIPGTGATLRFVETVGVVRESGFSIDEMDYLLRHQVTAGSLVAPAQQVIATALTGLRSELQAIAGENTVREDPADPDGATTDPAGDLTRRKLAQLNWDPALVEEMVATLNGEVTYEVILDPLAAAPALPNANGAYQVPLASRPAGWRAPRELDGAVSIDPRFLFVFDSATAVEAAAGGVVSPALRQAFSDRQITVAANAPVTVHVAGTSWTIAGRYAVTKNGNVFAVYDQQALELRASRFLSQPERDVLGASSTDASFVTATTRLFALQDELQGQVTYEPVVVNGQNRARLRFAGPMTRARKARLDAVSTDTVYRAAVQSLFDAPRNFIARYARSFSVHQFSAALAALPAITIPNTLKSKVFFDGAGATGRLHFIGVMTDQQRAALLTLSTDATYRAAINSLYDEADPGVAGAFAPEAGDLFLTAPTPAGAVDPGTDTARLFDGATTPAARFLLVLKKLLPSLRRTLSERLLVQTLADALALEVNTAGDLLTTWVNAPKHPAQKAILEFLAPAFAESHRNSPVTATAFPDQFTAFSLLHKISLVIGRLGITAPQLGPLFQYGPASGWLDLNALPVDPVPAATSSAALFAGWERLVSLFQVRRAVPFGELGMFQLFDIARAAIPSNLNAVRTAAKKAYLDQLTQYTSWTTADLEVLLGTRAEHRERGDLAVVFPEGYTDERLLVRLRECFRRLKRLGASATLGTAWGKVNLTAVEELANATSVKSAAKAKYTDKQWLEVAKPLKDPLRAKQRAALVSYLLTHSDPVTGRRWRDADELYAYFLVDVQMEPCMTSTRILQATNSAQLFIQRCLMNLEPGVFLSPEDARAWSQWRKQYRLWEANRKVLFYPENWIEPELRDDKSPFFEELESELQQNDLTMETAEDAFLHYLEKLDEVGRLEIVGLYRQEEAADPLRKQEAVDVLHVFGRTYAVPHKYFYRRLEKNVWTAWEAVDLDIEGDHLVPVLWNRRMHLFWPLFTEKTRPATKAARDKGEDPATYWEIKFAWSEYRNKGWSPKRVTRDWLEQDVHLYPTNPLSDLNVRQEPRDFSFKARASDGQLVIECYAGQIVTTFRVESTTTPPAAFPTRSEFIALLLPHYDAFKNALPTTLRCRFLINGAVPTAAERAHIRVRTRDSDGNVSNPIPVKALGFATSGSTYGNPVFVDLESEGFRLVSASESNSWWMPFNPVDYVNSIIETVSEAIADAIESGGVSQDVADTFLRTVGAMVAAAILTGGAALGVYLAVLPVAVGATISAVIIAAVGRPWGRRFIVNLAPLPAPEPVVTYTTTPEPRLERMMPLGEFVLDDCHGDLVRATFPPAPGQLKPLPGTRIENMMFAEVAGPDQAVSIGIDSRGASVQLLAVTPGRFMLVGPQQDWEFVTSSPFFFQDQHRTYFVSLKDWFEFAIHYHPRVCGLIKTLKREGLPGLLRLPGQLESDSGAAFFFNYQPVPLYLPPLQYVPREETDFSREGAYSLYNWELFFHIPFLTAMQLSKNQRFAEAQQWFHYIFDPTATDSPLRPASPGPERFWRVQPFYQAALYPMQTLEALVRDAGGIDDQVAAWQANPFKPHVVARMRVVAYMKAVVMRYIDNLIAWADQLFRRDTIETINEATQLYVLAAQILGKRPEDIPARARPEAQTFRTLDDRQPLNSLSNAVVEIESFLPPSTAPGSVNGTQGGSLLMPFFCITANDKLLGYWDTVADRLFKIRHCLNIEGVERALPLFQPSIDPALLVRATAAGVDLDSVLSDLNAAVPHYRFTTMMQKASELCNDVKALGASLLAALEKKDAEELSLLRSSQERGAAQGHAGCQKAASRRGTAHGGRLGEIPGRRHGAAAVLPEPAVPEPVRDPAPEPGRSESRPDGTPGGRRSAGRHHAPHPGRQARLLHDGRDHLRWEQHRERHLVEWRRGGNGRVDPQHHGLAEFDAGRLPAAAGRLDPPGGPGHEGAAAGEGTDRRSRSAGGDRGPGAGESRPPDREREGSG